MRILLAYYSRTGYTRSLFKSVAEELTRQGHTLAWEEIKTAGPAACAKELFRGIHQYPAVFFSLLNREWRDRFIDSYSPVEEDIMPLVFNDVSSFDRICVGGPKWALLAYPVAKYLRTVQGLAGKRVGALSTFGGPPLRVFELELIRRSMRRFLGDKGAEVVADLHLSSAYHEVGLMPLFRLLGRIVFKAPVERFALGSPYAAEEITRFCDDLTREEA